MPVAELDADALWPGEMLRVVVGGRPVVVVNVDGEVSAFLDRCAHLGQAVSEGTLCAGVIRCPVHEWTYDARSGHGLNPRGAALRAVAVTTCDGKIRLEVEDA
jgi:toluene monooxygenase system ferredoxin subunit